ncbi:60S ribosomal export protein NMD3 [Dichanthelium oligosanthes]|uniref:60S ribosomal export protein NMD3 n=1 Tax=Dichanthelium oligosanthes TaxID=888268 RepID=A0A1E5UWU1_9POAL|nr:60S ribosomal export protein NMD3 [Dichanthelium oligosanthes]
MLPSPQPPALSGASMFLPPQPQGSAACTSICCTCGVPMPPNAANTCARCLRTRVDITQGVPRHAAVVNCPACSSYLQPPRFWVRAATESPELMQILLRRVQRQIARLGVAIAAAEFVFTERHSKRLKLRLRLRREVLHGVTMEQAHVVEFTVQDRLCEACGRAHADRDQWSAVVQVRQRASHRRTLLHLEQQLLRHGAADSALRVDGNAGGLDLYLASRSHAARLVDFVSSVAPARVGTAKQLVSHDTKSNSYNFKHTFSVELCPIWGPSSSASSRQLVEYVVLDVEHDPSGDVTVSWAQVARASDFGKNDTVFTVKTHLGYQLKPGDHALGYDIYSVNSNNDDLEKYGQSHQLPDAVLAKKSYKKSAGELKDERERHCDAIEELAMGIGCIDLNPSDDKELDELLEDLTL